LLAWAIGTCFVGLGAGPVFTDNEAREGIYVRAMFDTGDFVLPRVPNHVENGEIFPDKPPLFHWISALATAARSALTTGRVPPELSRQYDEWTLRFPSALCGVLTVMSVALLGAALVGERAALLAALAPITSWGLVEQARYGRVDMALTCGVTTSVLPG